MTRKDYELIARAIKEASQAPGYKERNSYAAFEIADALAADNPKFDKVRFLKACGMEG